ncbi:MAG TPA: SRPBCC family protein [Acidimicrobiales bacterium]|nr:SRPBCC family protein [Acidimicrobiales bacterium]
MELTNDFRVGVPVERAWAVLTDVELIAPCMPGAQLQEVEGDEYRGIVKVKVGPITAQYKGAARFVERDDAAHKAVLRAEGRDTRGQGNANATITATLTPDGDGTAVTVTTDLTVTGRVAQFGRGVMADVSSKLLGQFVDCLENKLLVDVADPGDLPSAAEVKAREAAERVLTKGEPGHGPLDLASEGAAAARAVDLAAEEAAATSAPPPAPDERIAGTSGPSVRVVDSAEPEPVDLLEAAGAPVAKRAIPAIVGLTVLWLLSVFLRRRRRRRSS